MPEKAGRTRILVGVEGVEESARTNDIIIVVDVLRASSTIVTALANGALSILPTLTVKQARATARSMPDSILGGERKGLRIPKFELGNSPLEYTTQAVKGRKIVFTTTNCTRVLERCKELPSVTKVYIGAFLNAAAIAKKVRMLLQESERRVTIVQAGTGGRSSLDDLVCAEFIEEIIEASGEVKLTPNLGAIISSISYAVLSNTKHGRYLASIGFESDVKYCSQLSIFDVTPRLQSGGGMAAIIEESAQRKN
ncbi:MAG: 2-phosphosulfolactate phosphatase [Promethearchaeati archaeon SRVP18_Atabeyarchaeia-1]